MSEDASVLQSIALIGAAISDPWFVVDENDRILEFNAAFHGLFSRSVARHLKKMTCAQIGQLPGCGTSQCLRARCTQEGPFRLDELETVIAGQKLRLILNTAPVTLGPNRVGAIIVLRNVTDEAKIQQRYQLMASEAQKQQRVLEESLEQRTRQLIAAAKEIERLDQELRDLQSLEPAPKSTPPESAQ